MGIEVHKTFWREQIPLAGMPRAVGVKHCHETWFNGWGQVISHERGTVLESYGCHCLTTLELPSAYGFNQGYYAGRWLIKLVRYLFGACSVWFLRHQSACNGCAQDGAGVKSWKDAFSLSYLRKTDVFWRKKWRFFWGNEKRLRPGIFPLQRQMDKWLRSSVGQSTRLLIWGSWVQVPAESPVKKRYSSWLSESISTNDHAIARENLCKSNAIKFT